MTLIDRIKELKKDVDAWDNSLEGIGSRRYNQAIDDVISIIEEHQDDMFSELRGLLKANAQFPERWDTDKSLSEWLAEKGEL